MRSGIGISIVNSLQEELVYARFGDIVINASKIGETFQMTGSVGVIQADNQLLNADRWQFIYCQAAMADDENYIRPENLPAGVPTTARPALKIEMNCTPMKHYDAFDCFRLKLCDLSVQLDELLLWKFIQFVQATDASQRIQPSALEMPPNTELDRPNPLASRKCYFGRLELDMGQIALSVATIPKSGLPKDLRLLKQQFNIMLVSFENAGISLPPFRQLHYFETSSFLFELLKKFYFGIFLELQKKVMNVGFYLDAFGNPAGFVTDLKDFFAGLFIEGDVLFQIPCYGGWRKEALRIPRIRRLVCAHNGNDRFCAMGRAESTESTTRRRSTTIEKRATTTEHDRLRYAETKI